jgi:hypothetical protein
MRNLQISFFGKIVLIAAVSLFLPQHISKGCGINGGKFYGYEFYNIDVVHPEKGIAPFLLDLDEIYAKYVDTENTQKRDNLTEWRERFCNKVNLQDLHYIVYKANRSTLQDLRDAINSKTLTLSFMGDKIARNSFARYLYKHKCDEAINYLIFAKRCEPHVIKKKKWEGQKRDVDGMLELIEKGKKEFLETKSYYFRLRYAYQLIRLAHYAKKYELTLELYDYLMPKIDNDPSLIEDWIEGHRAGAMLSLGQKVEAAYIFSKIFDQCPSKRESAFRSFRIETDKEWEACLRLCKSHHEQATLHVLRAQNKNSRLVEEMKNIYALDPKNENLEFLLVREIKKLEKDYVGLEFNDKKSQNKRNYKIPRERASKLIIELQAFVRDVLKDGKLVRPEFWKIAEGYLELLSGDYYFAQQTFAEAKKMVKNDTLKTQLETLELVLEISAMEFIDKKMEERIYDIRTDNEAFQNNSDFNDFLRDKMAYVYKEQGDEAKAFLCYHEISELQDYPQPEIVDNLLNICYDPDKSLMEKQMILKPDGTTIKNDLLDMKANMYLSKFQPEKALLVYKEMPDETYWDGFGLYDPFIERINDCPNCALTDTSIIYNKGELINKLLELEQSAIVEADPTKTALIYYKLGLAYYNMTWYSYSWKVLDYSRNKNSLDHLRKTGSDIYPDKKTPYGNKEHFDCTRALYYFEKALQLSRSEELDAKAVYMAAKCEKNDYYMYQHKGAVQTFKYYNMLVEEYASTSFYAELMEKSKDFKNYIESENENE